jgi:protein-L-isoaspartate(D-aspartate) O-methyltransferase
MSSAVLRQQFAAALSDRKKLRSKALVEALARVPRENFLGPGPWLILRAPEGYSSSADADPAHLYADHAVAIDPARLLNNGAPGVVAVMLDSLAPAPGERAVQIGCGTGYYTAMLAEMVGPSGHVLAFEIDPELAVRATRNLRSYPQVEVRRADGTRQEMANPDLILVSAGATHPRAQWLDALGPGGRLVVPLTGVAAPGQMARFGKNLAGLVLFVERGAKGYAARFIDRIGVSFCHGARDPRHERLLREAFLRGGTSLVASLRREPHVADASCWLHGEGFCLSKRPASA